MKTAFSYLIFCLIFLVFAAMPFYSEAQTMLQIKVTDKNQKPVEDALVIVKGLSSSGKEKTMLTNTAGLVSMAFDKPSLIVITRVGFAPQRDTVYKGGEFQYTLTSNKTVLTDLVVTGQFEETTSDKSVQRIRVIDQKRIASQGAVNLKDLLSNELNIRISQDGVLGSQMSMMGIGGQNLKLLVDGVPVIGRMDGNIDLSQINLSNIERVEVIEGPMSVIYGTDALGGVINLISKRPAKKKLQASLNTYYESVGTYNIDGRAGMQFKDFQVSVSGGRNYFDGYSSEEGEYQRWKQWKPREQYFSDAQFRYKYKNQSHRLTGQFFRETILSKNDAIVTPTSANGIDNYFVTTRYGSSLYSDFLFRNKATLNLINSYSYYSRAKNTYVKNLVNGSEVLSSGADDHDTSFFNLYLSRATYTTHRNANFNSQLGYDVNIETGGGERLKGDFQAIGDYAAFYIAEIKPISRLKIHPGIRFIYNTRYGAPVIPSLNVKYDLRSNLFLRGSYARGFRAPSLKELSLFFVDVSHNIQGNENLEAEHSNNYNVNVTWLQSNPNLNIKAELSGFYNHMYNLISLALVDPNAQLYNYVNIDDYSTKGIYTNLDFFWKKFSVSGGYSLTGRYNLLSKNNSAEPFSYSNEFRVNGVYRLLKTGTDFSVFAKYNGALPGYALDANSQIYQTKIQAYSNIDASISQRFAKNRCILIVGAKNLLNVTNIQNQSASSTHSSGGSSMPVAMGRFYFITLKLNLEKE